MLAIFLLRRRACPPPGGVLFFLLRPRGGHALALSPPDNRRASLLSCMPCSPRHQNGRLCFFLFFSGDHQPTTSALCPFFFCLLGSSPAYGRWRTFWLTLSSFPPTTENICPSPLRSSSSDFWVFSLCSSLVVGFGGKWQCWAVLFFFLVRGVVLVFSPFFGSSFPPPPELLGTTRCFLLFLFLGRRSDGRTAVVLALIFCIPHLFFFPGDSGQAYGVWIDLSFSPPPPPSMTSLAFVPFSGFFFPHRIHSFVFYLFSFNGTPRPGDAWQSLFLVPVFLFFGV